MRISQKGIDLIKEYESLHDGDLSLIGLQPKMCPAGIWTEGYGHAMTYKGKFLKGEGNKALAYQLATITTEEQADAQLLKDIEQFEKDVTSLVKVPLTQGQFDALVSFAYNVGSDIDADNIAEGLGDSTLLRHLNNGDYIMAAAQFSKWNKSDGKILPGLVRRREAEKRMFLGTK